MEQHHVYPSDVGASEGQRLDTSIVQCPARWLFSVRPTPLSYSKLSLRTHCEVPVISTRHSHGVWEDYCLDYRRYRRLRIVWPSRSGADHITANGGVGFELAAQLLAKGTYHVLLGARSAEKGNTAVKDLESRNLPGSVSFAHIDVTDDSTLEAAAKKVETEYGCLDVLVNNAAIGGIGIEDPREQMLRCYDTNAVGPCRMGGVRRAVEEVHLCEEEDCQYQLGRGVDWAGSGRAREGRALHACRTSCTYEAHLNAGIQRCSRCSR